MRSLPSSEILEAWERGLTQSPIQRGITLLSSACPEASPDDLAKLSIGERDWLLLTLREHVFGPQLVCLTICPFCGEQLELTISVEDIRAKPSHNDAVLMANIDSIDVRFRLPNSLDLIAIADKKDALGVKKILIERCLIEASQCGKEMPVGQLPPKIVEAIEEKMAEADPQANVQLDLCCPACAHKWQTCFDIVSFFWSEIHAWAQRILQEVHTLASAYGWSEAEIIDMSPWRRQAYLDLVSQ